MKIKQKIRILTFHYAKNYGAVLQAYALKIRLSKDNEVFFSDYRVDNILKNETLFVRNHGIKKFIVSFIFSLIFNKKRIVKHFKFKSFVKNNFKELGVNEFTDITIVGSDQVWNFDITNYDDIFFLGRFNSKMKISYAASIGKDKVSERDKEEFANKLDGIQHISVRELSAKKLLSNYTSEIITVCLDPVFLMDKYRWNSLVKKRIIKFDYILVYNLTKDPTVDAIAKEVSQSTGMRIINITSSTRNNIENSFNYRNAGPIEFLNLFSFSDYVITNSFHGTAFSIIFEKEFITIPHKSKGTRMIDLCKKLELDSRIIRHNNFELKSLETIDYTKVKLILDKDIKVSSEYLNRITLENLKR